MAANKKKHGAALITGGSSAIGCELAMEFGARAETLILAFVRLPWPKPDLQAIHVYVCPLAA